MTNSEAKAILNKINPFIDDSEKTKYFESIELMIECFEENAKLKAEIEQLKSELEKSVKLPCNVGNGIRVLSVCWKGE